MVEEVKQKMAQFITDYYFRFDDNRVEFYVDDLKYNYFVFGIDDFTAEPDPDTIISEGSVRVNKDNNTVIVCIKDYIKHYASTLVFDSWNDFIEHLKSNCDWTEMLYMNWENYKI